MVGNIPSISGIPAMKIENPRVGSSILSLGTIYSNTSSLKKGNADFRRFLRNLQDRMDAMQRNF